MTTNKCCYELQIWDGFNNKLSGDTYETYIYSCRKRNKDMFLNTSFTSYVSLEYKGRCNMILSYSNEIIEGIFIDIPSKTYVVHERAVLHRHYVLNTFRSRAEIQFDVSDFSGMTNLCMYGGFVLGTITPFTSNLNVEEESSTEKRFGPFCERQPATALLGSNNKLTLHNGTTGLLFYSFKPHFNINISMIIIDSKCQGFINPGLTLCTIFVSGFHIIRMKIGNIRVNCKTKVTENHKYIHIMISLVKRTTCLVIQHINPTLQDKLVTYTIVSSFKFTSTLNFIYNTKEYLPCGGHFNFSFIFINTSVYELNTEYFNLIGSNPSIQLSKVFQLFLSNQCDSFSLISSYFSLRILAMKEEDLSVVDVNPSFEKQEIGLPTSLYRASLCENEVYFVIFQISELALNQEWAIFIHFQEACRVISNCIYQNIHLNREYDLSYLLPNNTNKITITSYARLHTLFFSKLTCESECGMTLYSSYIFDARLTDPRRFALQYLGRKRKQRFKVITNIVFAF